MTPPPAAWNSSRGVGLALALLLAGCGQAPRQEVRPAPPSTRLILGGDVMLARYVGRLARQKQDPAWPLRAVAPVLAGADIAFVNLESPFSDRGAPTTRGMLFKAAPEMVQGLVAAGVDVVSIANNHVRDAGDHGLQFTRGWLARHGILAAGFGENAAVVERNGLRFGFLAFTYDQLNGNYPRPDERIAMLDAAKMRAAVETLRRRADVIIVSMHAGEEYASQPSPQQTEFARAAIDAGALLVAGHHPHVVQPAERYRDGVIFYSLGNLVFDQFQRPETQQGVLAEITFSGARLAAWRLLPVSIVQTAPRLAAEPTSRK